MGRRKAAPRKHQKSKTGVSTLKSIDPARITSITLHSRRRLTDDVDTAIHPTEVYTSQSDKRRLANTTEVIPPANPAYAKYAGRRLGSFTEEELPRSYTHTAEEFLARRRLIHGVYTPPAMEILMNEINAARVRAGELPLEF